MSAAKFDLTTRLRRLRYHSAVRDLVRETEINVNDLVYPVFIKHGKQLKDPVVSMPGQFQLSLDMLEEEIKEICGLGIKAVLVFGIPEHKDEHGLDTYTPNGIAQQAIKKIKTLAPELLVISDVCLCQYTEHGHCGVVHKQHNNIAIDNDSTLELLAKQAVSHAQAGADVVAPSGMIDGMVKTIRQALDNAGFKHLPILSYSVKYRSAMYGPFGAATEGAAKIGDRRTYQMDPSNSNEAYHEALLDIEEGADMIIVKPAHTYLDIIYHIKSSFPHIPVAAYHVSGEYAMIYSAYQAGYIDLEPAIIESLTAIKRAGADLILSYFSRHCLRISPRSK